MRILGFSVTREPLFDDILDLVHETIEIVVTNQIGSLKDEEWAKPIKGTPPQGLNLADEWGHLIKNIIETRLCNHKPWGSLFRVIHVDHKYIEEQKSKTLNDIEIDIAIAAWRGKLKRRKKVA